MLTRTRAALAVAAAVGLTGIAACSSPSPQPTPTGTGSEAGATATPAATAPPSPQTWNGLTGEEIITQARTALSGASSYHVEGTLVAGTGPVSLDVFYVGDDSHCTWLKGPASAEVVRIGETTYVMGNAEFWASVVYEETAAALDGEWVEVDGPYQTFGASLVPDIATLLTPTGVLQPDDETTIDARPALTLTDGVITVAVAIEEPRYPLRIATDDGTSLTLDGFDAPVTIAAPAGEPISLAAMTGNS